jgi:hypothetical protein
MTNSIRWGLTTMTALGLMVGGAAFYGCSSSSNPVTTTEDTGTEDSATTDSTADSEQADTATEAATDADAAETPPPTPDRKVTLVHASPNAGPQFFCFGAGVAGTSDAGVTPPQSLANALFLGIPAATGGEPAYTPFPYGAIVPISFPNAQVPANLIPALQALTIVAWPIGATNPTSATVKGSDACTTSWATVKGDPTKFIMVPKNTVKAGTSTILYATGCDLANHPTDATKAQCAGQALKLGYETLDLTEATSDAGTAADTIFFHFFNASAFPTITTPTTIPGWQNVDVYLQPMTASTTGADGGTVPGTGAGLPVKIATGVSYGTLVSPAQPFVLPAAADANSTLLLLMPSGATACVNPGGAPSAGCPGWTLPLNTAAAAFQQLGGGFVKGTHQMLMIAGAPVPDPASGAVTIGFGNVSKP